MSTPLSPLAIVRKRPGMYIGDADDGTGLYQLLWEVVANALDEHLAGHCRRVEVTLNHDGSVTVRDDGRGIPVAPDESGKRFAERVLTELHDTPSRDGHHPHAHVGPGGAGLFVVNALSARLELETRGAEGAWTQRFERGVAVTPFARRGPAPDRGTTITFLPDGEIFRFVELDYALIKARLDELAALSRGLTFELRDERRLAASLRRPEGIRALIGREVTAPLEVHAAVGEIQVDIAVAWTGTAGPSHIASFVNLQRTRGGGTHVEGLARALEPGAAKTSRRARRAVAAGLHAVIHVVVRDARFSGPPKDSLAEPDVAVAVAGAVVAPAAAYFESRPDLRRALLG
jgi:DNA gyrase subunit B